MNAAGGEILGTDAGVVSAAGNVLSMANLGTIDATGSRGIGVFLEAGGGVTNQGTTALIEGSYGIDSTGRSAAIANTGSIIAAHTAIYIHLGGSVSNVGAAAHIDGGDGIIVSGAIGTIINSGTIGSSLNGYTSNYGIQHDAFGVCLKEGGSVTNNIDGLIEATGTLGVGVYLSAGGTILNSGSLEATNTVGFGVKLRNGGVITNYAGGLIQADEAGAVLYGATVLNAGVIRGTNATHASGAILEFGSTLTNQVGGLIQADSIGVYAASGSALHLYSVVISNAATIEATGSTSIGIDLNTDGTVTNGPSGLISGVTMGVSAFSDAGPSTIDNSGEIFGSNGSGIKISAGVIANTSTVSQVIGSTYAVVSYYSTTVSNDGTIEATATAGGGFFHESGTAIYVHGSAGDDSELVNMAGAVIKGANGFVSCPTAVSTVVNNGLLESFGSNAFAIDLKGGGTVVNAGQVVTVGVYDSGLGLYPTPLSSPQYSALTNAASGAIRGSFAGILGSGTGFVTNGGTISSGSLAVHHGFTATETGIELVGGHGTISNGGSSALIEGGDGIFEYGSSTKIYNSGTIVSVYASAGPANAGRVGFGIYLGSGGNTSSSPYVIVTNALGGVVGAIGSLGIGVELRTPGALINAGTAAGTGAGGVGVELSGIGTISFAQTIANTGLIDGASYGIVLADGGIVLNSASNALIEGRVGIVADGNGTVVNFGIIASLEGANGNAISFRSAKDILVDEAGSRFIGTVAGGGGTLDLAGKLGTLTGLGASLIGFASINEAAGAAWSLTGDNSIAKGALFTVAAGATLGVSGTVSGAGTLRLSGIEAFEAGSALMVADIVVTGGDATLAVNGAYAHDFRETAGTISLASHALNLTGAADFTGGTVAGTGYLETRASSLLSGLSVDQGAIWQVFNEVTASGTLTLGNAGSGSGRLAIFDTGNFDFTADGAIAVASGGAGSIGNAGLFEKTGGTGVTTIAAGIGNSGTIDAGSGTLDLKGGISLTGQDYVEDSATLEFAGNVAATQTVHFAGDDAHLVLAKIATFQAAIEGFDNGTPGDTIDVTSFRTGTTVSFSQPQSGETIVTFNGGGNTAKLTLFGQYSLAGFGYTASSHGTLISYTAPSPQVALVVPRH